jgi:hypothetical protein
MHMPKTDQLTPQEIQDRLSRCQWPALSEPYREALRQAVTFILGHVPDLLGIIASGTIVRGTPAPSSDLDLYVIRGEPRRQRIQRWFNGVPAEIFINPPHQVRRYLEEEHAAARPITAHMISTGHTVLAMDPIVSELKALAAETYDRQPHLSSQRLTAARYMAAARLEDALDVLDDRPETAKMMLTLAVHDMLHYRFLAANRFSPRDKDLLKALSSWDDRLAMLAEAFFRARTPDEAAALAKRIADQTIETYGFFEWTSEPEDVPALGNGHSLDKDQA